MKEDIRKECDGCSICLELSFSKRDEKEVEEERPYGHLDFVSMDLFTWNNKKFRLLTDRWSNFLWFKELCREPDSLDVIKFLEGVFREVDYPAHMHIDGR